MTENEQVSKNAAVDLNQIVEEERAKRVQAENYAKALVAEFASCNDFDEVRQKFRDEIKNIAPQALTNIVNMANYAESESVRASLNKWILEWAMSDKIDGSDNELKTFLQSIKSAPSV